MSYIFEALKKLEQKRQGEKVSRLLMVAGDFAPERKRWPLWTFTVVAILLLLNAVVMLWWVHPWRHNEVTTTRTRAEAVSSPPITKSDTPGRQTGAVPSGSAVRADTLARQTGPVPPVPAPKPDVKTEGAREPSSSGSTKVSQQERAGTPEPRAAEKKNSQAVKSSVDEAQRAPKEARSGVESRPAAASRLLDIKELPAEIKSSLPELKISAHYYTSEPQSRFTRINEVTLREGQSVSDGVKLEEITPEGVVLSCKGYRFRVWLK